mmetsp:Transcript_5085/g.15380  ORF Transcript_5085/g.15380 Transcript_5085/m.15380 type:complete len:224 (-) Transcript_5085:97-768(-)
MGWERPLRWRRIWCQRPVSGLARTMERRSTALSSPAAATQRKSVAASFSRPRSSLMGRSTRNQPRSAKRSPRSSPRPRVSATYVLVPRRSASCNAAEPSRRSSGAQQVTTQPEAPRSSLWARLTRQPRASLASCRSGTTSERPTYSDACAGTPLGLATTATLRLRYKISRPPVRGPLERLRRQHLATAPRASLARCGARLALLKLSLPLQCERTDLVGQISPL